MSGGHVVGKIDGTSLAATGAPFDNVLIAERRKTDKPAVHACFVADDGEDGWHRAMAGIDEDEAAGRRVA
jgi:aspartate kinase